MARGRPKGGISTKPYTPIAESGGNGAGGEILKEAPVLTGATEEGYQAFLEDWKEKGYPIADGDDIAKNGLLLLSNTGERRQAAVHYIASVSEAEAVFPKEQMKARILDQLARTAFPSEAVFFAFLDLFDWAVEFDLYECLTYCLLYLVGLPSVEGRSRQELVASVTTVNQNFRHFYDNKQKARKSSRDPVIS